MVFQVEREFNFAKLQIIRVSDRKFGAALGGRQFAQSPDMRGPTWLAG